MIIEISSPNPPVVEIGPSTSPKIEVTLPTPIGVNILSIPGPPGADGTIVHVGPTPPLDPSVNDLWVDTT
jgi:hypothetical protein